MLKKHLDNEEINQLPSVLEEPAMASVLKVHFVVVVILFVFFVGFIFVLFQNNDTFMIVYLFIPLSL